MAAPRLRVRAVLSPELFAEPSGHYRAPAARGFAGLGRAAAQGLRHPIPGQWPAHPGETGPPQITMHNAIAHPSVCAIARDLYVKLLFRRIDNQGVGIRLPRFETRHPVDWLSCRPKRPTPPKRCSRSPEIAAHDRLKSLLTIPRNPCTRSPEIRNLEDARLMVISTPLYMFARVRRHMVGVGCSSEPAGKNECPSISLSSRSGSMHAACSVVAGSDFGGGWARISLDDGQHSCGTIGGSGQQTSDRSRFWMRELARCRRRRSTSTSPGTRST
ncbi:hypothetical protein SAMN05428953_11895 [Mesorhizobium muleiense]|uniref:Uncharacterized protein n=1 Tax=Mesorhizobium muleiense TaxID=1004279 RepID=A0A1G9DQH4_9HYPH|nr:hypothetical protein SAMN05428953_11895 [Mesorhizobium muleiense]